MSWYLVQLDTLKNVTPYAPSPAFAGFALPVVPGAAKTTDRAPESVVPSPETNVVGGEFVAPPLEIGHALPDDGENIGCVKALYGRFGGRQRWHVKLPSRRRQAAIAPSQTTHFMRLPR